MKEPIVVHVDDLEWHEMRAWQADDRRASVWNRYADVTDSLTVVYTRYDPGVILEKHWHGVDEVIYVIDGDVTLGTRNCPAGSVIILDAGIPIGPIIAGETGTLIFEVFTGPSPRVGQDDAGYAELLEERGVVNIGWLPFVLPTKRER